MRSTVIALAGWATLAGCRGRAASPATDGSGANAAAPPTVSVTAVESRRLSTTLSLPAQITPYESVDIYPKVTGFIDLLPVDRGSRVHMGELIVRLSAPELVAQRGQADAAVQSAEAKLASDQGTYLHLVDAAKTPGVVAGNDLLIAEHTARADSAEVEAARDGLRTTTQLESYLEIRAPFDGVVTSRNMHPGALVGPAAGQPGAEPIVRIVDVARLRLVVPVPEAYVGSIATGPEVGFTVPAYPDRTFSAPVARIAHDVDQRTRTMAVELDVRNSDGHHGPTANICDPRPERPRQLGRRHHWCHGQRRYRGLRQLATRRSCDPQCHRRRPAQQFSAGPGCTSHRTRHRCPCSSLTAHRPVAGLSRNTFLLAFALARDLQLPIDQLHAEVSHVFRT